jgi:hypothetical protein
MAPLTNLPPAPPLVNVGSLLRTTLDKNGRLFIPPSHPPNKFYNPTLNGGGAGGVRYSDWEMGVYLSRTGIQDWLFVSTLCQNVANILPLQSSKHVLTEPHSPTCASPAGAASSRKARPANLASRARRCRQLPTPRSLRAGCRPQRLPTSQLS